MWPRSKILSRSSKKIALKYWTRQFGGCGWVGFSRSPPQNFPFMLALRGYFQNFHMSSQTHVIDFFVNCKVKGLLCYPTYWNSWWKYFNCLCLTGREKIPKDWNTKFCNIFTAWYHNRVAGEDKKQEVGWQANCKIL